MSTDQRQRALGLVGAEGLALLEAWLGGQAETRPMTDSLVELTLGRRSVFLSPEKGKGTTRVALEVYGPVVACTNWGFDLADGEEAQRAQQIRAALASWRAVLVEEIENLNHPRRDPMSVPVSITLSTLPPCCIPSQDAEYAETLYCAYQLGGPPERAGLAWNGLPCPTWAELLAKQAAGDVGADGVVSKWRTVAEVVWCAVTVEDLAKGRGQG